MSLIMLLVFPKAIAATFLSVAGPSIQIIITIAYIYPELVSSMYRG